MGKKLEAIQLDDFSCLDNALTQVPNAEFTLYSNQTVNALSSISPQYLASKIKQPSSLQALVASIYIAEDLAQASKVRLH